MKRTLLALAIAAVAMPLLAQDEHKLIARVNGREITNADLDAIWDTIPEKLQVQYRQNGGKKAFLTNFIAKKLIVQDAVKSGFAAQIGAPEELDAVSESALFDRYVREVVAAPIITEEAMRTVYDQNRSQFNAPEQAYLSIITAKKGDNPDAARETMSKAMIEIFSARTALASQVGAEQLSTAMAAKFAEVAKRVSDDKSAPKGGDLGFVPVHTLDPKVAQAARSMKRGTISGMLETRDSFEMVLVHEYRPAGVESFETAQTAIREFLMARDRQKVMQAVAKKTEELRAAGKVEIFSENLR